MSFAARLALNEGGHFAEEQRALVLERMRTLMKDGGLSETAVANIEAALATKASHGIPTELRKRPAFEAAYQHVHNKWKPCAS